MSDLGTPPTFDELDHAILEKLRDVKVPLGFQERLRNVVETEFGPTPTDRKETTVEPLSEQPKPFLLNRRWVLRVSTGMAVAASLALGFFFLVREFDSKWDTKNLCSFARDFVIDSEQSGKWKDLSTSDNTEWTVPALELLKYPPSDLSFQTLAIADTEYGKINGLKFNDTKLGKSAWLLQLEIDDERSRTTIASPYFTKIPSETGGFVIATMQEGSSLFVLLIEGPSQEFENWVARPKLT